MQNTTTTITASCYYELPSSIDEMTSAQVIQSDISSRLQVLGDRQYWSRRLSRVHDLMSQDGKSRLSSIANLYFGYLAPIICRRRIGKDLCEVCDTSKAVTQRLDQLATAASQLRPIEAELMLLRRLHTRKAAVLAILSRLKSNSLFIESFLEHLLP